MVDPPTAHARELPQFLRDAIQAELQADEHLLWAGLPTRRRHRRSYRILAVIFLLSVVLAVHLIPPPWFDLWTVAFGGAPAILRYPVLLTLVGVAVLLVLGGTRLARADRRTWYAVTDRRVILCEPRPLRQLALSSELVDVRSFAPAELREIECAERSDGSGDLIVEEFEATDADGEAYMAVRGMFDIADVRGVEQLIRDSLLRDHPR